MTNKKTFTRSDDRIIGGVCSFLSARYNYPSWVFRVIFIVTFLTIYSAVLIFLISILIYLILWLVIPNSVKKENKTKKYLAQTLGFFIGGIFGFLIALGFGLAASSTGQPGAGEMAFGIFVIIGIPFGTIAGFFIARIILEKKW